MSPGMKYIGTKKIMVLITAYITGLITARVPARAPALPGRPLL